MIGFNFRMTEIEAAIGMEQLKKFSDLVTQGPRRQTGYPKDSAISGVCGAPFVKPECSHVYYGYPMVYQERKREFPRHIILEALQAEGIPLAGSFDNIHLLPMYQQRIAYGNGGFPWTADVDKGRVSYEKGICPVAETLQDKTFIEDWALLIHLYGSRISTRSSGPFLRSGII